MSDETPRNDEDERDWIEDADDEEEIAEDEIVPVPLEASEPDVIDQHRAVPLDTDEHDR